MSFMSSKKSWICGVVAVALSAGAFIFYNHRSVTVSSILGTENLSETLLEELYMSSVFQRLKKIDQSGPAHYFRKVDFFSRFSHSLGVFALLRRHNCSLLEQAAGLMHDVSHTAFSHLGDYIFSSNAQEAAKSNHQDRIHLHYLQKQNIDRILAKYNFKINELDPDSGHYLALEQPLPDLCADRIEYILHTALVTKMLTKNEVQSIFDDLHFDGKHWFFTQSELARRFANLSLYYTKEFWGAPWNARMNIHFAEIIKRCFALGVLTHDDLFLTDQEVLDKIMAYQNEKHDRLIKLYWDQCEKIDEDFSDIKYNMVKIQPKFRGVDPLIMTKDGLVRLTAIDSDYNQKFTEIRQWCKNGFEIKVIVPPDL